MTGLEGRANLLIRLGEVLESAGGGEVFKGEDGSYRPGNMVGKSLHNSIPSVVSGIDDVRLFTYQSDYLLRKSSSSDPKSIHVNALWEVVIDHLGPVWPATRTKLEGRTLGDAWVCESLKEQESNAGETAGM